MTLILPNTNIFIILFVHSMFGMLEVWNGSVINLSVSIQKLYINIIIVFYGYICTTEYGVHILSCLNTIITDLNPQSTGEAGENETSVSPNESLAFLSII